MPTRPSRTIRLLGLLLLLPGVGLAQEEAAIKPRLSLLGRDDAAFARALFDGGLTDLAQAACETVLSPEAAGKVDEDQVLEARALALDLRLEKVRRDPDLIHRKEEIQKVLGEKNRLIDENSRTAVAEALRNSLPESYMLLGETLAAALDDEKDPAVGAKLREEGNATFLQAEDSLRQRIERQAEQMDRGGPLGARAERQHRVATYNLGKTLYFHGLLFPKGSPERAKYYGQCIKVFSDFSLDYPDVLATYEGYIYQGLCHVDLDKSSAALEDFEAAIELRTTWGQDESTGQWTTPAEAADVISAAVWHKVRLLTELKKYDEADAAARDFYATIPNAYDTSQGLDIVAAHAESRMAAGDDGGAGELAQQLVAKDPQGQGGRDGRRILGQLVGQGGLGGQLGAGGLVRIAEDLRSRGEIERALALCRSAIQLAHGQGDAADAGAQACTLLGGIYASQDRLYEASISFDLAVELFPRAPATPEALWRAADCYRVLFAREKRPFFEKRKQDRVSLLSSQYPSHPRAAWAILIRGSTLEDDGKYLEAAKLYLDVAPGTSVYEEAESRAGRDHYLEARAAKEKGDDAGAKRETAEAERILRKALTDIETSMANTLDSQIQAQLGNTRFGVLTTLATLLLETQRAGEVMALLKGVDESFGDDTDKMQSVWSLRIRALQAQGDVDQAVALFESLLQSGSASSSTAAAAGVLARALDQSAVDLEAKEPKSARARELWAKAVHYYELSVEPQLQGSVVRADEIQEVGMRLYALGLVLNDVPEYAETFVDSPEKPAHPEILERAAKIFEKLLLQSPNSQRQVQLGRSLGLLGRWSEAAPVYAKLFDAENIVEAGGKRFNPQVVSAKPQLIYAYLEWGVAEHMLAQAEKSEDRFARAAGIFEKSVFNASPKSHLWWQSKYYQARSNSDRGNYEAADIIVRDIKRGTDPKFDGGEFGYQARFTALEAELAKKVFGKPKPANAPVDKPKADEPKKP